MKCASDFRQAAREALRGKWGIAILVGLLAVILGGISSDGPEIKFSYGSTGLDANLQFAGQTVYSWSEGLPTSLQIFLAGSAIYIILAALVLAGSIPGAFLLKHVDARAVKVLFGVVVAALGAEMFSREYSKKRLRSSKIVLAIIGVTAGVLCGLFGVGALLAAYVSRVTEDGGSFKANISAVFIVDNTFRIVLYSVLGLLTFDTLKTALLLLPFALAGLFLGMKCSSRMNESLVKKITSILLVLSGISLILKNL